MKVDVSWLLIVCIVLVAVLCAKRPHQPKEVVVTDTITIVKTDTMVIQEPTEVARYITRWKTDTLKTVDSVMVVVNVPIEQIIYEDSIPDGRYKAYVSGYEASLDSLEIDVQHTNTYITTTTYIRPKNWSFGITGGIMAGYDPFLNRMTSGVGITLGLQYNFRTKKYYKKYGQ